MSYIGEGRDQLVNFFKGEEYGVIDRRGKGSAC